jgi:hypothetical protein
VLVGEALMRAPDPEWAVRALRTGAGRTGPVPQAARDAL